MEDKRLRRLEGQVRETFVRQYNEDQGNSGFSERFIDLPDKILLQIIAELFARNEALEERLGFMDVEIERLRMSTRTA